MKNFLISMAISLFLFSNTCLAVTPFHNEAFYYSDATLAVSGNQTKDKCCMKVGTSESINVLGLVSTGDAGIRKACQNGGIKKIYNIEQQNYSIYFFFKKHITKVYGE